MTKPVFDVHYADGRTSIVLEADLNRGWARLKKTYGFFRQTRIPYRNHFTIRAQMTVIAQPGSFHEWAREFPDIQLEFGDTDLSYGLHNRRLVAKIALVSHQPWRKTGQGRPELYVERLPFFRIDSKRWYDLRAWIVFHEPSPAPIPDVRVWVENRVTVPGGQFESKRRHH